MDIQRLSSTLCSDTLRLNVGCTLRLAGVFGHSARAILSALHEHDVSVEILNVYGMEEGELDMFDMGTMSLKFFASLKSLRLEGHFEGHPMIPMIPPDTKLQLTKLTVEANYLPSLALFDSILPAAPFLTSLELEVRNDGELLPAEYMSPFRSIAHQLSRLAVSVGIRFRCPSGQASLNVTRFVASCTSLKSLAVNNCGTAYFKDVVTASVAPLSVLETELASGWNIRGSGVAELASVLELPAMAKLKRWRMYKCDFNGVLLDQEARARWNAACRARGVEPRDETLLFTGKTTLSSSYSIKRRKVIVLCLLSMDEEMS
uniref:Uncharacterized protein n=1 Tax=Leucosporidium scottii TaxID=5278 RepID=A0A0H5FTE3_9BASI|nr:hypothetical protein [Leucosporidium scottii]